MEKYLNKSRASVNVRYITSLRMKKKTEHYIVPNVLILISTKICCIGTVKPCTLKVKLMSYVYEICKCDVIFGKTCVLLSRNLIILCSSSRKNSSAISNILSLLMVSNAADISIPAIKKVVCSSCALAARNLWVQTTSAVLLLGLKPYCVLGKYI